MGVTNLIIREFDTEEPKLIYKVGLSQIKSIGDENSIESIFQSINEIQSNFSGIIIQSVDNKYVLNQEHVYNACYFVQKALSMNLNISSKIHIELLLYLAANREISSLVSISYISAILIHS